jgi:hypothetical protein
MQFVYPMEDVLEVYTRPSDPRRPQVCLDEASTQLLGDTRPPLPARPGQVAKTDHEYARHGTAALCMLCEPLTGRRDVRVRARRPAVDWAHVIRELVDTLYPDADRELVDTLYPDAERIVLVLDNLNTHTPASRYQAFAPAEAKRLADRLELHYTPKHGSWLDMAELELRVLARQCLDDRFPDQPTLTDAVAAWETVRNASHATIDWRFTTTDARIKLKHLYPSVAA